MRSCAACVLTLSTALVLNNSGMAHHSFAGEFDNSMVVNVAGVVVSVEMVNPHSWIYLDVTINGTVERYALEGPGPLQIQRRGIALDYIKAGDPLGACGYLARSDATTIKREPGTGAAARKLQAAVLSTPDRGSFVWNNYRQGRCGLDN
jgi:hypothetical protein